MTAFLVIACWFTLAGLVAVLCQCLCVMVLGRPLDLLGEGEER